MRLPIQFHHAIAQKIPNHRVFEDAISTLAFGTDASFYRLIPKMVIRVESEEEVIFILQEAAKNEVPITFRAAGTSLSGQAVTDSVLVVLGDHWNHREILEDGMKIRLQSGVIGARANTALIPFSRKMGPDPASINSCKIGGIVANNASGMCCGTAQNSYQTLAGMRLVLWDGSVLDTEDAISCAAFIQKHGKMLDGLKKLADETLANTELTNKIRHKYRLKNTMGFALNSLVDFTDPLDILIHLMVGSEGTLGFISRVTFNTVFDDPCKASTLVVFSDIDSCCRAVPILKKEAVSAVELLDRRSMRSVQNKAGLPEWIKTVSENACALLIETRAATQDILHAQIAKINGVLADFPIEESVAFSEDTKVCETLWNIRKGTFPAVGAVRETGTTVIIEDVTFPLEHLATGVKRLIALFEKHNYPEGILFGHALEGNLHFVFTQAFDTEQEIKRYRDFMDDVVILVADELGGSLKAEHGTGRNMAPFVEREWGTDAYQLMIKIKALLDPQGILNPGVILNNDKEVHLKNFKPMPKADDEIDKCIECGFCEVVCPSQGLSLTPRQRIVIWREIQENRRLGISTEELETQFAKLGIETCAMTGLCQMQCPVSINTGNLMRRLSVKNPEKNAGRARFIAKNFSKTLSAIRFGLNVQQIARNILGATTVNKMAGNILGFGRAIKPPALGKAAPKPIQLHFKSADKVVYFASCISRVLGQNPSDKEQMPLVDKMCQLLEKSGFEVIFPDNLDNLCCGQPFVSKLQNEAGNRKHQALIAALLKASKNGKYPIICDNGSCSYRLLEDLKTAQNLSNLQVFDSVQFMHDVLLPRLHFQPTNDKIAVHVTCSTQHLKLTECFINIVKKCTTNFVQPEEIFCCGFAGDKGIKTPELNANSLRGLRTQVTDCVEGVSTSRTCETGLSHHSGIDYHGLVYLVDRVTRAKATI